MRPSGGSSLWAAGSARLGWQLALALLLLGLGDRSGGRGGLRCVARADPVSRAAADDGAAPEEEEEEEGERHRPAPAAVEVEAEAEVESDQEEVSPSCRCGDRGCMCDLARPGANLGAVLRGLGYDTCVEDGACESCMDAEAHTAYCQPTGHRQRVVCTSCRPAKVAQTLPFCKPAFRLFWKWNASDEVASPGAPPRNSSLLSLGAPGAGLGLFLRSCAPRSAHPRHFLRGASAPPSTADAEAAQAAVAALLPPGAHHGGGVGHGRLGAGLRPLPDESGSLLGFLAFNAAVLAAAGYSLHRQQSKHREDMMQGLYSHVAGEPMNGRPAPPGGAAASSVGGGSPERPKATDHRRASAASAAPSAGPTASASGAAGAAIGVAPAAAAGSLGGAEGAAVIGRSLATAITALELAAKEASSGSRQKMK